MKHFGEKEGWAYPGTAQIFWVPPIISGTGKATDLKFGRNIQCPSEQKPIKNLGEREDGYIQGQSKNFRYPLLSLARVKLRTSNFVRTFIGSIGTKVRYKSRVK